MDVIALEESVHADTADPLSGTALHVVPLAIARRDRRHNFMQASMMQLLWNNIRLQEVAAAMTVTSNDTNTTVDSLPMPLWKGGGLDSCAFKHFTMAAALAL